MTAVLTSPPQAPSGPGTWSLTGRGITTVVRLELRQRVRSTRWQLMLGVWVVVVGLLSAVLHRASASNVGQYGYTGQELDDAQNAVGSTMFGVIVLLVLGLGSLVAPALSATSVNGDRSNGVLATLQTTLLTPAEIAVGKLLASWATALALLAATTPFVFWAYSEGGTSVARLLVVLLLLAISLLVVCAIGLGWSAITARTTSSAVLTYLTVMFLGVGLPLLFAVFVPIATVQERVSVTQDLGREGTNGEWLPNCVESTEITQRLHSERIWWLLAGSPFVVVSDAAPSPTRAQLGFDPLTEIRQQVRNLRLGPPDHENWCYTGDDAAQRQEEQARLEQQNALSPAWPFGLVFDLAVAGAFMVITVLRLRAPSRRLARGTRVA